MKPNTIKILLLEDSNADVYLVKRTLKESGLAFEARLVDDESGFREGIAQFQPDLILADYYVPGFSGIDALRLARSEYPHLPFILISGEIGDMKERLETIEGVSVMVPKQHLKLLPAAVKRVMSQQPS